YVYENSETELTNDARLIAFGTGTLLFFRNWQYILILYQKGDNDSASSVGGHVSKEIPRQAKWAGVHVNRGRHVGAKPVVWRLVIRTALWKNTRFNLLIIGPGLLSDSPCSSDPIRIGKNLLLLTDIFFFILLHVRLLLGCPLVCFGRR